MAKLAKGTHHDNAKSFIALLIVLLAFGVFLMFYNNSEEILSSNQFPLFMTLATIGGGLLIGLLFLVNKPHPSHKAVTHKSTVKTASKKKKKK